ncbi:MAG: ABC-type transport auxiliary lipoprotein family protein [Campylobacterota bacterium]|nr:ABC-type transport auxiliary lipoprotein family protein [Campylobacterota bacterium]
MKNTIKLLTILATLLLFSGCTSKTLPSTQKYTLEITNNYNSNIKTQAFDIKILEPSTSKLFNNTYIYYSEKAFTIHPYALNKWSDYPTKMIEKQIALKLDQAKLYRSTSTSMVNGKYDYILQAELLTMVQIIEAEQSKSVLSIKFYILDKYNKNIASKTFNYAVKNNHTNAYEAVKSYNKALNLLLGDLFDWLSTTTAKQK